MDRNPGDLLTMREAAALLAVSPWTIKRYGQIGYLHPVKLPSGHYRYLRSEVEAIITNRKRPANAT